MTDIIVIARRNKIH